jgi:hypothetical protein
VTYNQIIERNQEFSNAHDDLNNFGVGGDFDMVLGDQENPYRYPLMWMEDLPSPIETGLESFNFRVYFLGQVTELEHREGDLISTNRNEVISNMRSVAIDFLSYWKQLRSDNNVRFSILTTINVSEDITPDKLFGVNIDVSFKVLQTFNKCIIPMSGIPTPESQDVSIYGNDTLMVTVACGNNYEFEIRNESGNLVGTWNAITKIWTVPGGGGSVDIEMNGNAFLSGQTGTVDIPVWDENDNPTGFDDGGVWRIGNSNVNVNDNLVASLVPSSNLNLYTKDSAGNNIGTQNGNDTDVDDSLITLITQAVPYALTPLRAEQPKSLSIIDAIDFDPIQVTVASDTEGAAEFVIPNSQVLVKDSAGTTLHTKVVKAGGSANQTVSDVTQTLNGAAITNNKAQTSKAITIRYANNDPVTVTTITDTETVFIGEVPNVVVPLNTSNPFKTGQTTSYVANDDGDLKRGNGASFTTLSHNNYFGNANRFTDDLGGQTYTSGWVIDWATWNQITGDFIMWYKTAQAGATWTNAMAGQPYNVGGFADCYLPNATEIGQLYNFELASALNYAPFNYTVFGTASNLWTSTTVPSATTTAIAFQGLVVEAARAKTLVIAFFVMRYGNISEL